MLKAFKYTVCVILSLAILAGAALGGYYLFEKELPPFLQTSECKHVYKDGKCEKCGKVQPVEDTVTSKTGLVVNTDNGSANKMQLRAAQTVTTDNAGNPVVGDSYTITAIVQPAGTTVTDFTWTMAWLNSASAWAQGKAVTDYVTLNTTKGLTVTLTEKAAFGEPVKLKCTYDNDSTVSAECQIDYIKQPKSQNGIGVDNLMLDGSGSTLRLSGDSVFDAWTDGTINSRIVYGDLVLKLNDGFYNSLASKLYAENDTTWGNVGSNYYSIEKLCRYPYTYWCELLDGGGILDIDISAYNFLGDASDGEILYKDNPKYAELDRLWKLAWYETAAEMREEDSFGFYIEYTCEYNGVTLTTGIISGDEYQITQAMLPSVVTNVVIPEDNIIFH